MSTEEQSYSVKRREYKQKRFELALEFTPEGQTAPMAMFDIALWTFNRPFLLMRHRTTNVSDSPLEDLRVYSLMDFDIGGPPSYRDDMARFDPETGVMQVWDEAPLHVELASKPRPTGWEISPPLKLKVTDTYRDLKNNLELGPRDIAVAVQWNLGTLDKGESKFVDVVISSGTNGMGALQQEDAVKLVCKAVQHQQSTRSPSISSLDCRILKKETRKGKLDGVPSFSVYIRFFEICS
jgi:hypothetical protein